MGRFDLAADTQVESADAGQHCGTGLGLSIRRSIVELRAPAASTPLARSVPVCDDVRSAA
jgi:hypothetical protein